MEWAKRRPSPRFDLAGSNVLTCTLEELRGAREAIELVGKNDNGYAPLVEAIAHRYCVWPSQVTTAQGTAGANFLVYAALLEPGDDVLVERPGYGPLFGAARLLGANVVWFERPYDGAYALDPDRVRDAMTSRTRLVVVTSPHNPSGVVADTGALDAIGRIAESHGAHVLVDEVYLDATTASDVSAPRERAPAATRGDVFITTSSLTKSYGLSGLRTGWVISSPEIAERIRRARDVVDGTGPIVTERLATLAFTQIDRLLARAAAILSANGAIVREFLRGRPELDFVDPGGGTVVFPRLTGVDDAATFAARLLAERETAVVPGYFFQAPGHVRIGIGGNPEALAIGLAEIGKALDERAW